MKPAVETMKPVDGKIVAKVFVNYRARLLKNYHPKGYEDEWLDKGAEITVMWMPHRRFYLNGPYGVFNSAAKEGKDFEFIMEGAK